METIPERDMPPLLQSGFPGVSPVDITKFTSSGGAAAGRDSETGVFMLPRLRRVESASVPQADPCKRRVDGHAIQHFPRRDTREEISFSRR